VRIPLYAYVGQMQKLRMTAMPVYRIHKRLSVSEGLGEKGSLIKIVAVDKLDRDLVELVLAYQSFQYQVQLLILASPLSFIMEAYGIAHYGSSGNAH
jgi:hypothetical protein